MSERYTLGIDFGTTNTTAAIQRSSVPPETPRLRTNSNAIPSAVMARDGGYLVDEEATGGPRLGRLRADREAAPGPCLDAPRGNRHRARPPPCGRPDASARDNPRSVPGRRPKPWCRHSPARLGRSSASRFEKGSRQAQKATSPASDGFRCVPRQTPVRIEKGLPLCLFRYDSRTDMGEDANRYLRGAGIDRSSVRTALPTTSPAKQRWLPTHCADPTGSIYSYVAPDKVAWLIWTYDDEQALAMAGARDENPKNLYAWWQTVGDT